MSSFERAPLRVLEVSPGLAGSVCGRLFAALGNDVIACEPPGGDPLRRQEPVDANTGLSHAFVALNAGKRSLVADVSTPEGRELVNAAAEGADVLIVGLEERSAASAGLSQEAIASTWPTLVAVSVTSSGADKHTMVPALAVDSGGDSLLAEAFGGLANMIGEPGRVPLALGGEQAAYAAGFTAFLGAMLGLEMRAKTGRGDFIDVALCDVAAFIDWKSDITLAASGLSVKRTGATAGRWRMVRAKDGWIGVIYQPEQWDTLVALIDDDRMREPSLRDEATRSTSSEWWAAVADWARDRTASDAYEEAQGLGLAFGYSADMAAVADSPQLKARGFVPSDGVGQKDVPFVGPLFRSESLKWLTGVAPPLESTAKPRWRPRLAPDSPAAFDTGSGAPLAGVRVLDFGTITAGAATSRLFADFGATVIKIEAPDRPDPFRQWISVQSIPSPDGASPMFESNNAGKLGLSLDLKTTSGRAVMDQIVASADVLVENYRVGVTKRLGIDFARLLQINPKLVYLSLSSQGQDGPEAEYRSYGSTLDLLSGLASLTGYPGEAPIWSSVDVNYPDQLVSLVGAGLVVHCLHRGVRGVHLDIAQREVVTWTLADRLADYAASGRIAGPDGNRRPGRTPRDCYQCNGDDQWVAVACATDHERARLAELISRDVPGILGGEAARTGSEAWWEARADAVSRAISQWTSVRTKAECVASLIKASVPCAPVLSASERARHPHFSARRVFLDDGHRLKGFPLLMRSYRPPRPTPAPILSANASPALAALGYAAHSEGPDGSQHREAN